MRKTVILLLALVLCALPSCAASAPEDLLEYQKTNWKISAECVQGDAHYSALLEIDRNNGSYRIEYTSPDELCGISLVKSGSECEISLFGASIPIEEYAVSEMLKIFRLFEIDTEDLHEFRERADDSYLAVFEDQNAKYELILDKVTLLPRKIDAAFSGESISLTINSMEILN